MTWSLFDRFHKPPRGEERLAEIARLEALRDRALAEASTTRWFALVFSGLMMVFCTIALLGFTLAPPPRATATIAFFCALFVVSAWMFWRCSFGEPRGLDPWERSDRYPTEDGNARTIQAKIDKLRKDAGPWG